MVTLVVGVQRASRFEDGMTDGASVVAGKVLVLDMVDQGGLGGAYLSTGHTLVGVLLSSPDTIFNILSVDGVDTFHICRAHRLMMVYSLPPPVIHRFRVEKFRLCSFVVPGVLSILGLDDCNLLGLRRVACLIHCVRIRSHS